MTNRILPRTDVIVTYSEAKKKGLPRYFTGKPCKNGHIDERNASNAGCCECVRIRLRAAYAADPGAVAKRAKKWRDANRDLARSYDEKWRAVPENAEKNRQRRRKWRDDPANVERERIYSVEYAKANADKIAARMAVYHRATPEMNRERVNRYAAAHPAKVRALVAQYRARKRGAVGRYTADDIAKQFELQAGYCFGCFADLNVIAYTVDHVVPLAKGGTNLPENLQLLCRPCNSSKGTKDNAEWWAGRTKA